MNCLREWVAGEGCVFMGPASGFGDLLGEGGGGEDLSEKRVGIEGDSLDELVKLLRGDWGRWWALLLLLRVSRRGWRRSLIGLGLLLVTGLGLLLVRWWRLTDDGCLREGDRGKGQQSQSGQRFVNRLHAFVYLFLCV